MRQEIKDEIENFLENTIELDYKLLKMNVEKIVSNYKKDLIDYKVVCDNTNNTPYTISQNFINVNLYLHEKRQANYIVNHITIKADKIKKLRKLRKKKLEKIYDLR